MKIITVSVGELETNCYILIDDSSEAVVIDPGAEAKKIIAALDREKAVCRRIIFTHGHADHIGAAGDIKAKYGALILTHPLEFEALVSSEKNLSAFTGDFISAPPADGALNDGDTVSAGEISLEVMHTPGHTAGGICLIARKKNGEAFAVFSGDTIFRQTVGRCDLPGGDEKAMAASVSKFMAIRGNPAIYPGHGSATTLYAEKLSNPFFRNQL